MRGKRYPKISSLPQEILENILERLPVKSLMRFRCVNKSLCTLLCSQYFIKKHLMRSIRKGNINLLLHGYHINRHNKMYLLDPSSLSLYFSSSSTCEIIKVVPICFPFISLDYTIDIVGTCDGLVCLSMIGCGNWYVLFLWNPSTREYKRLPSSPTRALKPYANKYGFGYDCSIDGYKLVKIVIFDESSNHSKVEVYSLNSNSWRSIYIIPWFLDNMKTGVFDDGALYWSVVHIPDENDLIIRFDLSNETFKEIPLPPSEYEEPLIGMNNKRIMELLLGRWPKWSFETGEKLIQNGDGLILFNSLLERVKFVKIHGTKGLRKTVSYVPSLVSLNSGTYVEQRRNKR